jgi:hypothetical protein
VVDSNRNIKNICYCDASNCGGMLYLSWVLVKCDSLFMARDSIFALKLVFFSNF